MYKQPLIDAAVVSIKRGTNTDQIRDEVESVEAQVTGLGWHALALIDDADLSDVRPERGV